LDLQYRVLFVSAPRHASSRFEYSVTDVNGMRSNSTVGPGMVDLCAERCATLKSDFTLGSEGWTVNGVGLQLVQGQQGSRQVEAKWLDTSFGPLLNAHIISTEGEKPMEVGIKNADRSDCSHFHKTRDIWLRFCLFC